MSEEERAEIEAELQALRDARDAQPSLDELFGHWTPPTERSEE